MIPNISIATDVAFAPEPRNKRAAKGLTFRGDHGQHARHDNSAHALPRDISTGRPELDDHSAIADSLYGGELDDWDSYVSFQSRPNPRKSAFTSQSAGFPVVVPKRHEIEPVKVATPKVVTQVLDTGYDDKPEFDEAGRPIVYKTDDAWAHRCAR